MNESIPLPLLMFQTANLSVRAGFLSKRDRFVAKRIGVCVLQDRRHEHRCCHQNHKVKGHTLSLALNSDNIV